MSMQQLSSRQCSCTGMSVRLRAASTALPRGAGDVVPSPDAFRLPAGGGPARWPCPDQSVRGGRVRDRAAGELPHAGNLHPLLVAAARLSDGFFEDELRPVHRHARNAARTSRRDEAGQMALANAADTMTGADAATVEAVIMSIMGGS